MPSPEAPDSPARDRRVALGLAALLALLTALAYRAVLHHRFLAFDDGLYVLENPHVRGGWSLEGLGWAFRSWSYASFYHPLTWASHMLDVGLFGLEGEVLGLPASGWHHATNLALHLAATLALLGFLRAATGATWRSFFVAAFFALHPLHVESVAWVAERKDVLSTALGFACLWAYARYATRPGAARYALVLALFVLGLLAKPMLVTWPCLMLLLDWWPLGRFAPRGPEAVKSTGAPRELGARRLLFEKLPFFLLSAAVSALSYLAQSGEAMHLMQRLSFWTRAENALASYLRYLGKTFVPINLAPNYPYRAIPLPLALAAFVVLAGASALALRTARSRPYLAVGWFWYLGTLVPVIGLVQVGLHAMADRYTYVPQVGLSLAIVWSAVELAPRAKGAFAAAGTLALAACAVLTAKQVRLWRDTVTLFEHACRVAPDNGWSHRILATAYAADGRPQDALAQYELALAAWPSDPIAHNNLGLCLAELGREQEALAAYREAVRLAPEEATYRANLGSLLARRGALGESVTELEEARRLDPGSLQTQVNLGKSLALLGRMDEAAECFRDATRIDPRNLAAWNNLASAHAAAARFGEAAAEAAQAVRLAREAGAGELAEQLEARRAEYARTADRASDAPAR